MADVPLHLVAARMRPPAAPEDDDEDWDAVIARAKMQAGSPRAPSPPPPPRDEWAEMPETPRPLLGRQASARSLAKLKVPPAWPSEKTQATLDALVRGGMKKPAAPRQPESARRAAGPVYGPTHWPRPR